MDIHDPELNPILMTGELASENDWTIAGCDENLISLEISGDWHTYEISVAWHEMETDQHIIRLVCAFTIQLPVDGDVSKLYELFNLLHHFRWASNFAFDTKSGYILLKRGIEFHNGEVPPQEELDFLISDAVSECDKYYPAIEAALHTSKSAMEAMGCVIHEAQGTP